MPQYQAKDESLQFLYVDKEFLTAISTIETGMAILQNNRLGRRNEFPFMTLLANGIERLLKIVQHLAVFHVGGRYLSVAKTHNLDTLRRWMLDNCFTPAYLQEPNMHADREYLANDPVLLEMFAVLSDFADAKGDRYLYMDAIVDPHLSKEKKKPLSVTDRWPDRRWAKLEDIFIKQAGGVLPSEKLDERYRHASRELVRVIERFMRIVGRFFAFRGLGATGTGLSAYIHHFTTMHEDAFGKNAYEI